MLVDSSFLFLLVASSKLLVDLTVVLVDSSRSCLKVPFRVRWR